MVDSTNKSHKQLHVSSTGNAVLFTNTGIPSPIDLSSSQEHCPTDRQGSPIHITKNFNSSTERPINGTIETGEQGEGGDCNEDQYYPFPVKSEACIEKIKQDWTRAVEYLQEGDILSKLREMALHGELESQPLRGIAWRLFLGTLPTATEDWIDIVNKQREKYNSDKNKADIDPHKNASSHPLSNESNSAWNQFFLDQDLWLIVDQDVSRTWPEERIFTNERIRNIMRRVLFTYAKSQSKVDYRQGMHELLANIIYMMCREHERCPVSQEIPEYIRHVVDPSYLEEDAYTLFSELMEYCDIWYDGGHEEATFKARTNIRIETPFEKEGVVLGLTALSKKLNKIQGTLLKKHDPELSEYMDSLELSPQVYGIRWIRLLFGREFILKDILLLWDALFAQGTSLDLIDYIAIAILMAMKNSIIDHDQGDCLLRLMKYPQDFPVRDIINHALHLKHPSWPNPYGSIKPVISSEKLSTLSSPPREQIDYANNNSTEDPSKWSKMKVNQNWKSKSLRSNTIQVTNTQPLSIRSKIQSLPRPRVPKSAHTQLSNPLSSPKKQSESSLTGSNSQNPVATKTADDQISNLEKEIEFLRVKSDYCVGKLTAYVDHLQDIMYQSTFATKESEDLAYLAIAGIKQVRDVLKGQLELGDSSFGLDSNMYHYLRESNPNLVEDHISKDSPPSDQDKPPRYRLGSKELEEDSVDLFTNTSPPISAEMVEIHSPPDPLLDSSQDFPLSPSHPLEYID
ncbi:hypothetical protein LOD99_13009 [Oopsacas minuta]|uniref:Rab-GAP TBC domain-containing protein n=1 Tax=Oopsacas minuta TaxID=111878 RepID=A0AAV7JAL5_9METZ|nr:hypothetical protein LOD99_13009 [Oopsacas minuta]